MRAATFCISVAENLAANGCWYPDGNTSSYHLHQRSGKPARQRSLTDTPKADIPKRTLAIRTSDNFAIRPA